VPVEIALKAIARVQGNRSILDHVNGFVLICRVDSQVFLELAEAGVA
jgi:hypothetical protein